jgi:hypothetical protein
VGEAALCFRIFVREFVQSLPGDHMHTRSYKPEPATASSD